MNALVTGASSGIGREMAKMLSHRGYHVILVARRESLLEELSQELPYGATVLGFDLAKANAAEDLYEECQRRKLPIEVLINNAGFGQVGPHCDISPELLNKMNQLNIITLSSLCRLFGDQMRQRGSGCILNVGSTASYLPIPFMANYSATKAYVNSFTNALRAELSPHGVQVGLLNPGPTETEFGKRARTEGDFLKGQPGIMSAKDVAHIGLEGLFADTAEIIPGLANQALPILVRILPKRLVVFIAAQWLRLLTKSDGTS